MNEASDQKPKFKLSIDQIIDFNDDCIEACLKCPQVRLDDVEVFEDRDIFRKNVKSREVVKWWEDHPILWESGYHVFLSEESLNILDEYKLYKAKKRIWKRSLQECPK